MFGYPDETLSLVFGILLYCVESLLVNQRETSLSIIESQTRNACQIIIGAKKTFSLNKIEIPAGGKFMDCSLLFVFSKVLPARKINWITARACRNIRTARMLANAPKDYSLSRKAYVS